MAQRDVVVVGTSAGGVAALQTLAAGLPASFPAAVLVVMHLSPQGPGLLPSILAKAGPLPAESAVDGALITAGRIYVAPPDRHLLVEGERIRLSRGPKENCSRPAVDVLFRSAAATFGPRVIGIVLTGMLDDGTAGLWAIKERRGLAIVQTPADAKYPSMPESALRHVAVDHTLPVSGMPALLTRLVRENMTLLERPAVSEAMRVEAGVAKDGHQHVRETPWGRLSPNTCPECHGTLSQIREGSIVRYRCHTGHAYSLLTLLASLDTEVDATLWGALRVVEERCFVLRELAEAAHAVGDAVAHQYSAEATANETQAKAIRQLALSPTVFGREREGDETSSPGSP